MEYGCIGAKLSHSFSKEIHARLASYRYDLVELAPEELAAFMQAKDFRAINVTIPYKQDVIPYLYEISPEAKSIGAVNTIVNRDGRLYGYNTDFFGILSAMHRMGFPSLEGKKVLILGTGGTSRTAAAVAAHLGAKAVIKVSRTAKEGAVTYEEAARLHGDAEILFNTSPSGMYPHAEDTPLLSLADFPQAKGVFDAVYNPLRTNFILEAEARGIAAIGGLYMLVAQAFRAVEIFLDTTLSPALMESTYHAVMGEKQNTVLIGMPACGKTTVGRALAEKQGRKFLDLDEYIVKKTGKTIPSIFAALGEEGFRAIESEAIADVATENGLVIATGGGAVLRKENVRRLKQNGRLYFLDRPVEALLPTPDRPTASSPEAILARYQERYPIYTACADEILSANGILSDTLAQLERSMTL